MLRLHCTKTHRDVLASLSSLAEVVNTSAGPVAYVGCTCGATVILEAGIQTWHGPATRVA